MPRQGQHSHSSTTDDGDTELVMRMIELMNDGRVLQELKKQLYPTELYDKLDTLTSKLESISIQLTAKDHIIHTLETTVNHLEQQLDAHEQYSRRPNLRVQGIPEEEGARTSSRKSYPLSTRRWASTRHSFLPTSNGAIA